MVQRPDEPLTGEAVVLDFPFQGRWMARNSPARRVPSHGSHLLGTTYAIDFIRVDVAGRSARWDWRAALSTEPPDRFVGFGSPILAPLSGEVVLVHNGEIDHVAHRSLPAGIRYALTQRQRARTGAEGLAGNHVVIAPSPAGPFVLLAHLRADTIEVSVGDVVTSGAVLAQCGNSGNSYQPHVHVQATDSTSWVSARGLPIRFRQPDGSHILPKESQIITV